MDKQLEKLNKIAEVLEDNKATQDEVAEALAAVLGIVAQLKDQLEQNIAQNKGEMEMAHKEMYGEMKEMEEEMKEMHTKILKKMVVDNEALRQRLTKEVNRCMEMMPEMPNMMPLEQRISEVEAKIPKIPEELTPLQVKNKLESLVGDSRLDKSAVKGLDEIESDIQTLKSRPLGRIGGMKKITTVKKVNLTSQVNGVLKAFTMPKDTLEVLGIFGTQFPVIFDPTVDYTFNGTTLTLGDSIAAPSEGQTLWALIVSAFYG